MPALGSSSSGDLLASARSLGNPFPWHLGGPRGVPGLAPLSPVIPPRAGRRPLCTNPSCEQVPGRAGAEAHPREAMLWFEGLIPTLGTGQGEEKTLLMVTRSPAVGCPALYRQVSRVSPAPPVAAASPFFVPGEQRHPSPRRRDSLPGPLISRLPDVAKRVLSFWLSLEAPSSQAAANHHPSALVSLPGTRSTAARLVTY